MDRPILGPTRVGGSFLREVLDVVEVDISFGEQFGYKPFKGCFELGFRVGRSSTLLSFSRGEFDVLGSNDFGDELTRFDAGLTVGRRKTSFLGGFFHAEATVPRFPGDRPVVRGGMGVQIPLVRKEFREFGEGLPREPVTIGFEARLLLGVSLSLNLTEAADLFFPARHEGFMF